MERGFPPLTLAKLFGQWADKLDAHHAEIEAMARDVSVLRSLAAVMYQAAGAYDMPVRFLDALSAVGNSEPITEEQVDALLPCEEPEATRDAARYRFIRDQQATIIYKRKETGEWEPLVDTYATSTRCASLDAAIDQAMHDSAREGGE